MVKNLNMIDLNNITLVCIDCLNHKGAIKAIMKSCEKITFEKVYFFTDYFPVSEMTAKHITIDKIKSKQEYSDFVHNKLVDYIETDFVLIIQNDGYIINPELWDDNWLNYDYIGAPWWYSDGYNVGNGGFSLRSKKLLKAVKELGFEDFHPEDDSICRKERDWLEQYYEIEFAPEEVAAKFSFEKNGKYYEFKNNTFGFHGLKHLVLV